jgi:isochorismate hydrolase
MDVTRATTSVKGGVIATATPYPWPYHATFEPAHAALVTCLDPTWRLDGKDSDVVDENLVALSHICHQVGVLVISVTSTPVRGGVTLDERRTPAAEKMKRQLRVDVELESGATDAFYASRLEAVLRHATRTDLLVAGWGLEGPVHSTLRAANDRGYECLLVADASSSLDASLVKNACSMVEFSGGIFGAVATTPEVLELLTTTNEPASS